MKPTFNRFCEAGGEEVPVFPDACACFAHLPEKTTCITCGRSEVEHVQAIAEEAGRLVHDDTAERIECHSREYRGRLRGVLVDAPETRAYLSGLAAAAAIARGGRARLPEGGS